MPKRALITGITGQDGSYLAELLLEKDYEVIGMVRRSSTVNFERIAHLQERVTLVPGDLLDEVSMIDILRTHRPVEVYNLAAQSFVQTSFAQPVLTGEITALGVTRLLDAIRIADPDIRFYQASSSEMFGKVVEVPQTEVTPFHPRSPYGVAKVYGHWITVNYRESYGMHASSGVLFNHESPRRGLEFVTRKITHTAARIKLGLTDVLRLGNLEAQRDWGFAGDYVDAMWRMLQQDEPGTYVISTDETHSVREFCQVAFDRLGLNWEDHVVVDEQFFRPAEVDLLVGQSKLARTTLDWTPKVGFEELVHMMVDADIDLLSASTPAIVTRTTAAPASGSEQPERRLSGKPVVTLAGGVGAAKMLSGLTQVVDGPDLVAIVNVGDDTRLHGLHISPDLDTVTYTLAGAINPETGWGLVDETWNAMGTLRRYGGVTWFGLGDRDIGTHLYRTQRLDEGATLAEVTAEITAAWSLGLTILPSTNDSLRTRVTTEDEGEIGFQEYFVKRQHAVPVRSVRFAGAEAARPGPGVLQALQAADTIVIAPSNPIVSIGPVLAVPGVRETVESRRARVVAVSPIIAGAALKGPADRLMTELGLEASVVGVARLYASLASVLVIDEADRELAPAVEAEGIRCVVAPTIMSGAAESAALARVVLASVDGSDRLDSPA